MTYQNTLATSTNNLCGNGFESAYKNKKVLVTGHTGFKGSWLTQWLLQLKADVYGYALSSPTSPSLFEQLHLADKIHHQIADIRDTASLQRCIAAVQPDVIFHLAAQPLVRDSYRIPLETVEINTMGTLYVLEAVRQANISTVIVAITTDKCYENKEWEFGYRETDPMGGYDPYSSSKGAAELLISSWRYSFFNTDKIAEHGIRVASVRAGNVIGGGDWAKDRIIPDCMKSLLSNVPVEIRNPHATRPWQHVLEPLGGYLLLGARLLEASPAEAAALCSAFNFGPNITGNRSVAELVDKIIDEWGSGSWHLAAQEQAPHEAKLLHLSIDKAYQMLHWHPQWAFEDTIGETVRWYKAAFEDEKRIPAVTVEQIEAYQAKLFHHFQRNNVSHGLTGTSFFLHRELSKEGFTSLFLLPSLTQDFYYLL
jgi:CDP-glucose 4,6-dehydratase